MRLCGAKRSRIKTKNRTVFPKGLEDIPKKHNHDYFPVDTMIVGKKQVNINFFITSNLGVRDKF